MDSKDQKIQNILNSLDGMQRASPGPFFYTRVSAALQKESLTPWERVSSLISRPVIAIVTVCVIVTVNLAVLMNQSVGSGSPGDLTELAIVDEYAIATTSIYDYENPEVR